LVVMRLDDLDDGLLVNESFLHELQEDAVVFGKSSEGQPTSVVARRPRNLVIEAQFQELLVLGETRFWR
jgi:hypothetical protein